MEINGADIFELFGLTFESFEEKKEPAYINLRFKTIKEKSAAEEEERAQPVSSVASFLQKECIYSQFQSDYISFEELVYSYNNFCKNWGIPDSQREQIIGSEELIKLGALIFYMAPPKRIVGIKRGVLDDSFDSNKSHGLIRV